MKLNGFAIGRPYGKATENGIKQQRSIVSMIMAGMKEFHRKFCMNCSMLKSLPNKFGRMA